MNEKKAVYWHQGMFLQPQHFQQADRHADYLQKLAHKTGTPYFWGIGSLELSESALANRSITIRSAQLIFSDGSQLEFPGNTTIATRSFHAAWAEQDSELKVYLGLRQFNIEGRNVTEVSALSLNEKVESRFVTTFEGEEVNDQYSDGPTATVRSLHHAVQVFFGPEIEHLQGYELIPIAQLTRDGDGVVFSDKYIPPCYMLSGSRALMEIMRDIRDEFAGRTHQLQEFKRPREQRREVDQDQLTLMLALQTLNRFTPALIHLLETPQVHPWTAYGLLRQIVGELSTFSERFNLLGQTDDSNSGLPAYNHIALAPGFLRAKAVITHLLNELTLGANYSTVMEYQGDDLYLCTIPPNHFGLRNRFYLLLRTQLEEPEIRQSLQLNVLLAASEEISTLSAHALPGLELIYMPTAPQGLPRKNGAHYFRIEQASRQWDAVERDGQLALYWADGPSDLKAEVVVLEG